ncbi:hypothetical protein EJB05_53594, partial [Eragrostis curvula]
MAAGPRSAASIESGWPEQAAAASARGPGPPSGCGERAAMATVGLRLQFSLQDLQCRELDTVLLLDPTGVIQSAITISFWASARTEQQSNTRGNASRAPRSAISRGIP